MDHFIIVSGFTQQKWAKHGNGSTAIYRNVRALLADVGNIEFSLLEWHEDPKGYAKFVAEHYSPGDTIAIAAYSYGGGFWLRVFLRTLKKIAPHIKVNVIVVCDPVLRFGFLLARPLALLRNKLKLNFGNISKVIHFRQLVNRPGGNALVLDDGVVYDGPTDLDYPHVKIDNCVEYHDAVIQVAMDLFLKDETA